MPCPYNNRNVTNTQFFSSPSKPSHKHTLRQNFPMVFRRAGAHRAGAVWPGILAARSSRAATRPANARRRTALANSERRVVGAHRSTRPTRRATGRHQLARAQPHLLARQRAIFARTRHRRALGGATRTRANGAGRSCVAVTATRRFVGRRAGDANRPGHHRRGASGAAPSGHGLRFSGRLAHRAGPLAAGGFSHGDGAGLLWSGALHRRAGRSSARRHSPFDRRRSGRARRVWRARRRRTDRFGPRLRPHGRARRSRTRSRTKVTGRHLARTAHAPVARERGARFGRAKPRAPNAKSAPCPNKSTKTRTNASGAKAGASTQ